MKWPPKDPDESLNYSIDWSRFVGSDTITGAVWFIVDANGDREQIDGFPETVNGLTISAASFSGAVTTATIADGTNGYTYRVACQITYGTSGLTAIRTVQLPVRNK